MMVPSRLIAFSGFIMSMLRTARPRMLSGPAVQSTPDLPAIARKTVRAVRTRTLFAWTCFVHVQRAAIKFLAVERILGRVGVLVVIHRDKRKPARFTRHLVHHQMDFVDGAVFFEQILKIVLGGLKREITYVQFHCVLNMEKLGATEPFPGIGFQTTNERRSPDDLPCSEVKQSDPISAQYRPDRAKHKRLFHGTPTAAQVLTWTCRGCFVICFPASTSELAADFFNSISVLPAGKHRSATAFPENR